MIMPAFSLKTLPFQKNIPADKIFLNQHYREMKNRLDFLFEHRGIGLFTGEIGSGKSTMIRIATAQLNTQLYKIAYLHKELDKLGTFYTQLALKLGIQPRYRKADVARQVSNAIIELSQEHKIKTILIIDEAHLLKSHILEEIRLLHNAEMDSKDYLTTALIGQPPLKKMLNYMNLQPLAQRITVSYHLPALSREQAYQYLEHHLKTAGASSKIFKDNALETIINAAKGIPRILNNIALKAMYEAVNQKMTTIDQECVMNALEELGLK